MRDGLWYNRVIMGRRPQPSTRQATYLAHQEQKKLHLWTRQRDVLSSLDCLSGVPPEELDRLVDLCTLRTFLAGEPLISERMMCQFLYIVLQGSAILSLHQKNGEDTLLEILNRGDCCGEGPLFSGFSLRTGVQAQTHCYVLQFPLIQVRSLLARAPMLKEVLRNIYLRRLVEVTLARVPFFSHVPLIERLGLAGELEPIHYPRGSTIMKRGETGTMLYIIESGQAVVKQDDINLFILDEGDFFGEIALVSQQMHSATVEALTPTNVLALPKNSLFTLASQHPHLNAQLHELIQQRIERTRIVLRNEFLQECLNTTIEHGLYRGGNRLLARLPERCPSGCHICEIACAARHGRSRLRLNGVQVGKYDIVAACRQCRAGAECIEVCPEEAFEWNEQGALLVTDKCTMCGECVAACPYKAIFSATGKKQSSHSLIETLRTGLSEGISSLFSILSSPFSSFSSSHAPNIKLMHLHEGGHSFRRAIKCDLCHGYDDMACVQACPVSALQLVPVETILEQCDDDLSPL